MASCPGSLSYVLRWFDRPWCLLCTALRCDINPFDPRFQLSYKGYINISPFDHHRLPLQLFPLTFVGLPPELSRIDRDYDGLKNQSVTEEVPVSKRNEEKRSIERERVVRTFVVDC